MKQDSTYLAIEVSNYSKDGISALKKALKTGTHLYQKGERLFLYPLDKALYGTLDNLISSKEFDPLHARYEIVWLDINTGQTEESEIPKKIANEQSDDDDSQVEFYNNTFEIYDFDNILNFIEENQDIVKAEEATLVEDGGGGSAPSSTKNAESVEEGNEEDSEDDSEQEETLENVPESHEDSQEELQDDSVSDEEIPDAFEDDDSLDDLEENDEDLDQDELFDSIFGEEDDESNALEDDVQKDIDPLVKAAQEIFNKSTVGVEFPNVNKETQALIGGKYVESKISIEDAKDKAIDQIYQLLKNNHNAEYEEALKTAIKDAQDKHDENIKNIHANLELELKQIENDEQNLFEKRKEEYGQSKLNDIYAKYEADHRDELNSAIEDKRNIAEERSENEVEKENKHLANYVDEVKESIFEHVTNNIDVEKIINGYKSTVVETKQELIEAAEKSSDENNKLKNKVQTLENTIAIQNKTYDSRLKAEIAKKIAEATEENLQKVKEAQRKADDERNKFEKQVILTNQLNQQLIDKTASLAVKQQTDNMIPQTVSTSNSVPVETKKGGWGSKALAAGIGVMATLMLVMGGVVFKNQMTPQSTVPQTIQTTGSQNALTTDSNGEFVYTTKDGKKYHVTKDDSNSGHYKDEDGKYHTVIFNKQGE